MDLSRSLFLLFLFFLLPVQSLWSQEAEVILGPKLPAGVSAEIITADSHMVMVDLQGRKKQKIASYALPRFEPIEEFTLDLPKGAYFSHFVPVKDGAVAVAVVPDQDDYTSIKVMIKQFIPGKFALSKWITLYEGTASRERRPYYLPVSFKDQPDPELMKKPDSYFTGFEVIWSEKENLLYTCFLKSTYASGTSIHLVKINLGDESIEARDIRLSKEPQPVYLNHFSIQNGHFLVETSLVSKQNPAGSIDHLYVIKDGSLDIKEFSINSFLPINKKISSNTIFISNSDSDFSVLGIIEPADNSGSHYSGLLRIRYNLVKGRVDTCIIEALPYEYFESSRAKLRRHVFIDQSWSDPDGTIHLACYSYYTETYRMTGSSRSAGSTSPSTYTVEAYRCRELVLIDLNSDYSIYQHQLFQRNVFYDKIASTRVLAYAHNTGKNLIHPDLKEHYAGNGERKENLPESGPSIHTTLALGRQNNENKWVFTELKLNSNYTYYPSRFVQTGVNEFVCIAFPSVSKNRICLIKIKEE